MRESAGEMVSDEHESGHMAMVGLLWVAVLLLGGLFVVDAIGALETEPDECYAYAYGSGPGGYGCNPLLGDAYFEVDQTDDLVDRQTVHINGFLFDPNRQFGIVQCSGVSFVLEDTPSGITACDLSTVVLGSTDANGSLSIDMRVRRIITTPDAGEVDCGQPEAACVIAGGVLGTDGMSTTEAAFASITFDPDVPPVPAPTVSVEVGEIAADSATLIVDCPNAINLSIDVQVQQEIDGLYGYAYGYLSDYYSTPPPCADGPVEFEVTLESGSSRRLGRGAATYEVYVYASDGFEGATATAEGEFRLRRTPQPTYIESNDPGNDLELELLGITGRGEDQAVRLAVTCDRPVTDTDDITGYRSVSVQVGQWAGLDQVRGYGSVELDECDGRTTVSVPIIAYNGRLQSGDAQLEASAYIQFYDPETDFYYSDSAHLADKIRLRGVLAAELQEIAEQPDSRITIDSVTRNGVAGTIACDEPVNVDLQLSAQQYQGRIIRSVYAYGGDFDDNVCDGTLEFDVEWNTPLSQGTTAVTAYASAYTVNDDYEPPTYPTTPPYPTAPAETTTTTLGPQQDQPALATTVDAEAVAEGHIIYAWFDQQGTTVRVRR